MYITESYFLDQMQFPLVLRPYSYQSRSTLELCQKTPVTEYLSMTKTYTGMSWSKQMINTIIYRIVSKQ